MIATFKGAWDSYLAKVVPDDAGPTQVMETKMAFYAGASIIMHMFHRAEEVSDDVAETIMSNMMEELDLFFASDDE